jgi:membrane protein DedA with SNARE-associated domain
MDFEAISLTVVAFVQANQRWAPVIVFLVSFAECVAMLSLLVPGTFFLLALGVIAGSADINLFPLAISASCGAGLGFWVSYWFGFTVGPKTSEYWPLNKNPEMLEKGHAFFEKWGILAIILGHFLGPVRAVIAVVAGIVQMPMWQFNIANWIASFAWGFGLLYMAGAIGDYTARWHALWGGFWASLVSAIGKYLPGLI